MKKTFFALLAAALLFAACSDFEPTKPDMKNAQKALSPEFTGNANTNEDLVYNFAACFGNIYEEDSAWLLDFNFGPVQDGTYDIFKDAMTMTTAAFNTELQKIVKFSSFTAGTTGDAKTPSATTALSWSVDFKMGLFGRIKFTGVSASTSSEVQLEIDPVNFTVFGGQQLDLNNDGKIDEYDTYITKIYNFDSTDLTSGYVTKNYRVGLFNSMPNFSVTNDGTENDGIAYNLFNPGNNLDTTTDYTSTLNQYFKLQEFSAANGWQDSSITGTYTASTGEFKFPIAAAAEPKVVRVRFVDYESARKNAAVISTANFCGVSQQLFGTWPNGSSQVSQAGGIPIILSTSDANRQNAGNNLYLDSWIKDSEERNVAYFVALDSYSDGILPDPAAALDNGTLRIGYTFSSTANLGNQFYWNSIVFFKKSGISIEILDSNYNVTTASATGINAAAYWKVTLPSNYKAANNNYHYLIFTPDVKTTETTVRHFGNYSRTVIIPDENGTARSFFGAVDLGVLN